MRESCTEKKRAKKDPEKGLARQQEGSGKKTQAKKKKMQRGRGRQELRGQRQRCVKEK